MDAEAAGVKSATVYAAAMARTDPESKKRGAWLKRFLGHQQAAHCRSNCMGAFSYHEKMFAIRIRMDVFRQARSAHFPVGRHAAILATDRS